MLDDGYLYDPYEKWGKECNPDLVVFEEIAHIRCLVLLGEPGIGKTKALETGKDKAADKIKKQGDQALFVDLRACGSEGTLYRRLFESSEFSLWKTGTHQLHIFLDSLDECLLRVDTVASFLVDEFRLYPEATQRIYLRIACRTAIWQRQGQLILEAGLKEIWERGGVGIYELAPLRRVDVVEAASVEGLSSNEFVAEIRRKDIVALAIKPVTLNFLLNAYRRYSGKFPDDQSVADIYLDGCRLFCEEINSGRRSSNRVGDFDTEQRLAVAARIAAVTILTNRFAVRTEVYQGDVPREDVHIRSLSYGYEYANGRNFEVTRKSIEEVLDTGLFSARGTDQMGWSHQTYAEFLAALYLVQNKVSLPQIVNLFFTLEEQGQKLIPQLHETSAWLASMRPDVLEHIIETDPDVLLRSDLPTDAKIRASIISSLLAKYEKEQLFDWDRANHRYYSKLDHPELAGQLRPYICDSNKQADVRDLAVDIAEACKISEIQKEILDITLDSSQPVRLRASATRALCSIGDTNTRLKLEPLASQELPEDEDDQLRGYILKALWPDVITAKSLFGFLSKPKQSNLLGSYKMFMQLELTPNIDPDDLVVALDWVINQGVRDYDHPFQNICNDFLVKAWELFDQQGVSDRFVHAALIQWRAHQDIVTRGNEQEKLSSSISSSQKKRRTFVEKAIKEVLRTGEKPSFLVACLEKILASEDFSWMLDNLKKTKDKKAQAIWADLIRWNFSLQEVAQINEILLAAQTNETLRQAFSGHIEPIELDSIRAKRLRSDYIRMNEGQSTPLLNPPPKEIIRNLLDKVESGDLTVWWQINRAMTLRPESTHYGDEFELELTSLFGWKDANDADKRRILDAAQSYIQEVDAIDYGWIGTNTFNRPSIAGCRAFLLLLAERPTFIKNLPTQAWKRWAPIIIAASGTNNHTGIYLEVVKRSYLNAPQESIKTLLILIDKDNKSHDYISVLSRFDRCWDGELALALLQKATDIKLKTKCALQLLEELIQRGISQAKSIVQSLVVFPIPASGSEREKVINAASILVRYAEPSSWESVWPMIQCDVLFGRELLESASFGYPHGIQLNLTEVQLADLYIWLVRQYPYDADVNVDRDKMDRSISNRDRLNRLRDTVLSQLKEIGTIQACEEIQRIIAVFPNFTWLKKFLLAAQINMRRKTWQPMEPEAMLQLIASQRPSIRSSLDRLEKMMADQPNNPNFSGANFNAPVNFAPNYGNQAQNLTIQNTEQNFEVVLADFMQFVTELQAKHPNIGNPEIAAQTIAADIRQLPQPRLNSFLSLKRLWNGGKKAATKVGEHFVESSVWGKGAIAFLEGVTEEI